MNTQPAKTAGFYKPCQSVKILPKQWSGVVLGTANSPVFKFCKYGRQLVFLFLFF